VLQAALCPASPVLRQPYSAQDGFRAQADEDAAAKDVGGAALALAILAAFCRVPELARSQEVVELVPLLVKARAPPSALCLPLALPA